MTEDNNCPKLSNDSTTATATATKQRKKRKWDQPAESFVSAGLAVPGVLPFGNMGSLTGPAVPGITSLGGALLTNPVPVTCATITQVPQGPSVQLTTATMFQKINLPKIQDELIAREIVINDAEPTVRYKLTKRQTQEEIQRCTGAVVITRGKYRPPNALPDSEKPLYLHISAGSHLKDTAERIIAVDHAAAMVEEMLKHGQSLNPTSSSIHSAIHIGGQVFQTLSACVFLGFDPDPLVNIGSRIRGPNDQYINHIMNETGATVVLRGRGSANPASIDGEELQQPLHLFLSSNNPKGLEDAKLLAENLLDTIASECGASRVSSSKVYKAVPPPPQLLVGVQSAGLDQIVSSAPVASMPSPTVESLVAPVSSAALSGVNGVFPQAAVSQPGGLPGYAQFQPNTVCYPQSSVCGTSYSGYGGIYPQATPLQQVALVLRQSPSPSISVTAPATSAGNTSPKANTSSNMETERRPPQKRKFQELPVVPKLSAEPRQNLLERSELVKPGLPFEDSSPRSTSSMPPPKKLVHPSSNGMMPPPPRSMPPPPSRTMPQPPLEPALPSQPHRGTSKSNGSQCDSVPDTLIKLMEYGDDDDDPEEESLRSHSKAMTAPKPFWAV